MYLSMFICIYQGSKDDVKAPFSSATKRKCRGALLLSLVPSSLPLIHTL